jgi:beta-glucosidase
VGYKWYDANKVEPLFPFGYGLSYSTFSFSDLDDQLDRGHFNENQIQVSFDVSNLSDRAGSEVAQVYVAFPSSAGEPPRRLIGWRKVWLEPWQTQHIQINIDPDGSSHPLSFWDSTNNRWELANGEYSIYIGDSSRHTPLSKLFSLSDGGN